MDQDFELFEEIEVQAARAAQEDTADVDLAALASTLHAGFPHKSAQEIEAKLQEVWKDRGLTWRQND